MVNVSGLDRTLKITCDNFMTLWLDGELTTVENQNDWVQISTINVPLSTRSIAVKCVNQGGGFGIIGSIQDADGDTVLVTDKSWRCSKELEDGWEKPDFEESKDWKAAAIRDHPNYNIHDRGLFFIIISNFMLYKYA